MVRVHFVQNSSVYTSDYAMMSDDDYITDLLNVCSVAAGLRTITYMYGMQQKGNEQLWDKVWNMYMVTSEPVEKYKLLKSLAQTRLVWLVHRSDSY